ncbi:MAG: response regulator [Polyangiales bacterium]
MLGKRLLVIEDDGDSLHAISELLARAGYEVLGAETGREGLRHLHGGTHFDLVLLDFWLPDMTGHALLATRTRWPGALSLPVLLVTGDDAWVDEHRDLRQLGVVGLLRKPLDPEELLRAVERGINAGSERSSSEPTWSSTPAAMSGREPDTAVAAAAARQGRRLSDLLSRVSDLLAQSMDATGQLRDVARLLVPAYASACVFERSDPGGLSRQVLCAHHETQTLEAELRELAERPEGLGRAIADVLESGEPRLYEAWSSAALVELGCTETDASRLLALGCESVVIVPLIARRRVFGTLTCASPLARRRYARTHLDAVADLAHRVALALDNAELCELAQQASRAREDLLAVMSRELRTPLSTIVATANKALQNAASASETEHASVILRNARTMEAQIRDLLDYAQLAAGNLRVALHKEQLAKLVTQVFDGLRPHAGRRLLELEIDPEAREVELACDADRVRHVVYTLLDRALRVSAIDGRVGVRVSQVEGDLHVSVSDAGTSLSAEEVACLSDAEDTLRRRPAAASGEHGVGAGHELRGGLLQLAIARGLVEAHGGRFWVHSQPGVGNTFHFSLRPQMPQSAQPPAQSGPVILLVDSDLAFRRELHEILVERGYNVETADNGWQAWSYLQTHAPPALILLDLTLPVMDGWELHAAIKSHPELAAVPTVIVSGLDRYRIEASLSDAQGYIEKPIRTAQLFEVVLRYVASPARGRTQSLRPETNL